MKERSSASKQKFTGRGELIKRLASQVGSESMAVSILKKRGQMDSSGKLTASGRKRDNMTASERAKDRASKASGKPASSFKYNKSTNRATVK
jgi:hypothetical protein